MKKTSVPTLACLLLSLSFSSFASNHYAKKCLQVLSSCSFEASVLEKASSECQNKFALEAASKLATNFCTPDMATPTALFAAVKVTTQEQTKCFNTPGDGAYNCMEDLIGCPAGDCALTIE